MEERDRREPSRMQILISLFLVRGPFALGLLWKSGLFEHREKLVFTAAVLLYTAIIAVVLYVAALHIHTSLTF